MLGRFGGVWGDLFCDMSLELFFDLFLDVWGVILLEIGFGSLGEYFVLFFVRFVFGFVIGFVFGHVCVILLEIGCGGFLKKCWGSVFGFVFRVVLGLVIVFFLCVGDLFWEIVGVCFGI